MTLTAIAEEIGISPSTAHSTLGDMLAHGVISQDEDKRYRTGPALYYWGSSYARSTPLFRSVWRELVDLCNELGVVGALAVPWDDHHLILQAHHAIQTGVGVAFGGRVPLDAGSWGKAYYAWSEDTVPDEINGYTKHTIMDRDAYLEQVQQAIERGYATDFEEFEEGVQAVASAVTGERGYEGLASCLGPVAVMERHSLESVGRRLATITARASFSLGDSGRIRVFGSE